MNTRHREGETIREKPSILTLYQVNYYLLEVTSIFIFFKISKISC